MNTKVTRDRAILKRLVESYGKADVLKFVKNINESNAESDVIAYPKDILASIRFFVSDNGTVSTLDEFGEFDNAKRVGNNLILSVDGGQYDIESISDYDEMFIVFAPVNYTQQEKAATVLKSINNIMVVMTINGEEYDFTPSLITDEDYNIDPYLTKIAVNKGIDIA
jgi:hypothetical protein